MATAAVCASALLLAGCARAGGTGSSAAPAAAGSPSGQQMRGRIAIVPLVDHHQHLVGPTAVLPAPPSLPPVTLPAELDRVIQERNRVVGSADTSTLFTEDVRMVNVAEEGHPWVQGRAAAQRMAVQYSAGSRFVANGFTLGDSAASISGEVFSTRSPWPRVTFTLGLRRGPGGAWRIASEQAVPIPARTFDVPVTVEGMIRDLDVAGIERAVVLSVAYFFGSAGRAWPGDEYTNVRAENDWTAAQVARYPDRLVAFCGIAPLRDYAVAEVQRCRRELGMRGIKMHFRSGGIDIMNPEHRERVRQVFRAANEQGMAIVVHSDQRGEYGPEQARMFLEHLLPAAPDVVVQIAHLWGGNAFRAGPLGVFADAVSSGDPRTKNLYFDLTEVEAVAGGSPQNMAEIARRIRQIGLDRILYGSDAPATPAGMRVVERWARLRHGLALTDDEMRDIADNVAPYLR